MNKKISVIVPMYNAGKTIEECLDSLVCQTILSDMEIIIVDDKSSDESYEIVKRYENDYPENIILIKLNENEGPGNARNVALSYAAGEYIGFVDSDDAVLNTMYEKLYAEAIKVKADYVDSGFYDQKKDRAIVFVSDELAGELDDKKKSSIIAVGGYICTKIFNREFLETLSMGFRKEYVLEDMDYLIECTARARRIGTVKEIMYIYRDNGGSLSKSDKPIEYIHNQTSAMKAIYERTHMLPNYEGIREAVEFAILTLYSNVLNVCKNLYNYDNQSKDIIIPMMDTLRKLKDSIVKGGYSSEYIRKGIRLDDLDLIKNNDISPQTALTMK